MADERKAAYIRAVIRDTIHPLIPILDKLPELDNEYFDCSYTIVDDDVAEYDITAAQFTACITFMQQLNNMVTNSAVTTGDYWATLNVVRRAPT